MHVVFVCTGNICRSPMAEGLLRKALEDTENVMVGSAGVGAPEGQPPSEHAIDVLIEENIDIRELRSTLLDARIVDSATLLFAMTHGHKDAIEEEFPAAAEKTFLLCEFSDPGQVTSLDVPDPIGLSRSAYLETRDQIKGAIPGIIDFLKQTTESMTESTLPPQPSEATTAEKSTGSALESFPAIAIGADHGGVAIKDALVTHLRAKGCEVADRGTDSGQSVDYPDFAHTVCHEIADEPGKIGILVCTTGIGMSIVANRHPGIRAALVSDPEAAAQTRRHNDSNILCLAGGTLTGQEAIA
ncbi:MAG: RpiB/LacA/LacB family sugar-phosphate isomerase, partial [Verrucomicrobiales bacterium]